MSNFINPSTLPPQLGLYSHVATARGASLVFIAGQLSVDHEGAVIGAGDLKTQLDTVMHAIGAALRAVELDYDCLVQMTTFLTRREDIVPFYERRAEIFPTLFGSSSYPPNTLIIANGLVLPDALIEIQAIASDQAP